jgi:hypothetical protein
MSLVNEALKRAKQAQPPPSLPPSAGPQLRPVEPAQQCLRGVGLALPVLCALAAMLAILFVGWAYRQHASASPAAAVAQPTAPVQPAPAAAPAVPPAPAQVPVASSVSLPPPGAPAPGEPRQTSTPALPAAAQVGAAPASTLTSAASDASAAAELPAPATNAPAVAELPVPKPAPLRLQAILYHPTRPSAMIGGKTVFLGDKVGEARVASITAESVTLIGSGRTNVLNLAQ